MPAQGARTSSSRICRSGSPRVRPLVLGPRVRARRRGAVAAAATAVAPAAAGLVVVGAVLLVLLAALVAALAAGRRRWSLLVGLAGRPSGPGLLVDLFVGLLVGPVLPAGPAGCPAACRSARLPWLLWLRPRGCVAGCFSGCFSGCLACVWSDRSWPSVGARVLLVARVVLLARRCAAAAVAASLGGPDRLDEVALAHAGGLDAEAAGRAGAARAAAWCSGPSCGPGRPPARGQRRTGQCQWCRSCAWLSRCDAIGRGGCGTDRPRGRARHARVTPPAGGCRCDASRFVGCGNRPPAGLVTRWSP